VLALLSRAKTLSSRLVCGDDVKENARQFVGGGGDAGRPSQASAHLAIVGSQIRTYLFASLAADAGHDHPVGAPAGLAERIFSPLFLL